MSYSFNHRCVTRLQPFPSRMRTRSFDLHGHIVFRISISLRVRRSTHPHNPDAHCLTLELKHVSSGCAQTQPPSTADEAPSFLGRKSGKFNVSFRRRNFNTELSNKISRNLALALLPSPSHAHRRTQLNAFLATSHLTIHKTKCKKFMNPRFAHTELATHFVRLVVLT